MEVSNVLQELLMFVGVVSGASIIYAVLTYTRIKVDNHKLNTAIDIVLDIVDKVSQTYVDKLKKQGKFDKESQVKALTEAIEEAKSLLPDAVKSYIQSEYGNMDAWLESKIESYIHRQNPEVEIPLTAKPLNG